MNTATLQLAPSSSLEKPAPSPLRPAWSLWALFSAYRWRMLFTYGLFNLESLLRLAQPWVLGWAIHDLLQSSLRGLAVFFGQHLLYLVIGAARRMYDTRTFTRIYADLASQLVLDQRGRQVEVSRVAARSALSREIVNFFERDVAGVFYILYSVVGALLMLCLADWVLAACCLALLLPVCLLSRWNGRQSLRLNGQLNDELEREVEIIHRAQRREVRRHYHWVARWRIMLADREACSFGLLEFLVFGVMAAALVRTCEVPGVDAGRIFAVFGYVLMFVNGVINVPLLVQQFNRLRDISRRMQSSRRLQMPSI
jgi:hypothetical protein